MSKESWRRPGQGYAESHERIMPTAPKHCQACGYLPVWCKCVPIVDGPGRDVESTEGEES